MEDEKSLLKKLIELYEKQENIKVKYEIKERGKENEKIQIKTMGSVLINNNSRGNDTNRIDKNIR